MKKQILTAILLMICITFSFLGCNTFTAQDKAILQRSNLSDINFIMDIQDKPEPIKNYSSSFLETMKQSKTTPIEVKEDIETVETTEEVTEQSVEEIYNDYDYNNDFDYYDSSYIYADGSSYTPDSGLTQQSGVNYYDGRTEKYYSSNVSYHDRTDEWTVDDEGFYRTDDGYYVVAASDMPQGTTFEGSKGTCVVLDSGCDEGVTDYYVAW